MENYHFDGTNKIMWELPNLQLCYDQKIALSHIVFDFKNKGRNSGPILVTTNLIDRNSDNPEGLIMSFPGQVRDFSYAPPNLEFWKIDSIRPRQVMFTLEGVVIDTISFVSITLAIQ